VKVYKNSGVIESLRAIPHKEYSVNTDSLPLKVVLVELPHAILAIDHQVPNPPLAPLLPYLVTYIAD
jgi:hypothetical protein